MSRITLALGAARSGKSRYAQDQAEAWARARDARPVFIATAQAGDAEMAERIARHRAERGPAWTTLETPLDLAGTIAALEPGRPAVVDCLTLWLTNALLAGEHEARAADLLAALPACPAPLWLVGNEVGWGIVPDNALARAFRDAAGRLHQDIARLADEVVLLVAGLPLTVKPAKA